MDEVQKLRWLADARAEYVHGPFDTVEQFHSLSPVEKLIAREVMTVRRMADVLEGRNDACGWLPSWRWDEWSEAGRKGTQ